MRYLQLLSFIAAAGSAFAAPQHSRRQAASTFLWGGREKMRGVNIGGWLVLEPWITPSIFERFPESQGIVDEYTLVQSLGREKALREVLEPHWQSWVGPEDFQKIAKNGLNTVRIPIGFWAFDPLTYPYARGAEPYFESALGWARNAGLKVIVDLHGLPGSQNGFDNSGQRLETPLQPMFGQGNTEQQALDIVKQVAEKYGSAQFADVVIGIELVNEPFLDRLGGYDIKPFYQKGYDAVRSVGRSAVILGDGFKQTDSWNGFMGPMQSFGVAIDHHEYQAFDNRLVAMTPWEHRQHVCNNAHAYSNSDKWTFVGEWTGAMTDCAQYLNGYLRGARYDGTWPNSTFVGSCADKNDLAKWAPAFRDDMRGYIEAQLQAFEARTAGWVFWNFKTERSHEWDYFRLVDSGVFPSPPTDRKFGPVCTNM